MDVSKDWMDTPRHLKEYQFGVERFLHFAFSSAGIPQGEEIQCPCKKCCNRLWLKRDDVYNHLICHGFVEGYRQWFNHGESFVAMDVDSDTDGEYNCNDNIDELLHDRFRDTTQFDGQNIGPNECAKEFYKLVDKTSQELYPGYKGFTRLSFIIRLYLLKCLHGWSNASFTSLLELLKGGMPYLNIPTSFDKTKNMIKNLGLDFQKIDACPNDCMLYQNGHENDVSCHVCGSSRYVEHLVVEEDDVTSSRKSHKFAAKTLRHFPLIPKLQRLFMCTRTVEAMSWHHNERVKDGSLRHPADGESWKAFGSRHEDFAKESRNVRLGLASDGFNLFQTLSSTHSIWPVVLMVYNLPPWMSMKPDYFMLSLLIPGPQSPENDIDVFLQLLIEELKELWESEKNIVDSIIRTLLDIPGKTKDHAAARFDLKDMGIGKNLQPKDIKDGKKTKLAKACFSMTPAEKTIFCGVMKGAKLPDGSASNISRCVQKIEKKISGYKTHDAHFMLHYLLQVCQKVISLAEVANLEAETAETLYQLERIFPPRFFDIMVHLPIHVANEVRLGGPVQYRWMYPVERYLLEDVQTRLNRVPRNNDECVSDEMRTPNLFPNKGCPLGGKMGNVFILDEKSEAQGHAYILNNCDKIEVYMREHESQVNDNNPCKMKWEKAKDHSQQFSEWFKVRAMKKDVPGWAKGLARGPNRVAKRFSCFVINRYRFHTRYRDARRKTQNSGVTLEALTPSFASVKDKNSIEAKVTYYGKIIDMFELDYYGQFKVVLFKCEWYTFAKDNFGLSYVYFSKKCYQEESFVLASQVNQCFYVQYPYVSGKHYLMKIIPRDLFRISDDLESDSPTIYAREPCEPEMIPSLPNDNGEVDLVRNDLRATIIDMAPNMFAKQHCEEDEKSEYDEYMEVSDFDSS
ncbi:uncharacterized protein [Arachis hypogaea]|uniref:uncharacterized protein n=1 Tax=Arachis hypogaea TaxID=3818 RepID=UPI003B22395B